MQRFFPLIGLIVLTGCLPADYFIRLHESIDDSICVKRGGDYDDCRVAVARERQRCLKQWDALPPDVRQKLNLQHFEARPPEIRACNALGV
jgi:hypothetical protein